MDETQPVTSKQDIAETENHETIFEEMASKREALTTATMETLSGEMDEISVVLPKRALFEHQLSPPLVLKIAMDLISTFMLERMQTQL